MKSFKIGLLIFTLLLNIALAVYSFLQLKNKLYLSPLSDKNDILNQIQYAINSSDFKLIDLKVRSFRSELEAYLQTDDSHFTKVILSTQKNPYWQVASLQQIINAAKIRGKYVKLIDLSSNHPYATIQDN